MTFVAHKPPPPQSAEMLRNGRLCQASEAYQFSYILASLPQLFNDPHAGRVSHGAEEVSQLAGNNASFWHECEPTVQIKHYYILIFEYVNRK